MEASEGGQKPLDQARRHAARQALLGERDRLLKHGTKQVDLSKFGGRSGRDRAKALLITLFFAPIGMVGYIVMMVQWFVVFHSSLAKAMIVFIALMLAAVALCVASLRRVGGKDRAWLLYLGALLAASTLVALVVGFFLYYHSIVYYWKYNEMRTYTNVAASQDRDAFQDGAMFLFTRDTKVDVSQGVGYQSRWNGKTYCAAPVVDSTMGSGDRVYFWAVGEGCCQPRSSFFCGDAMDQASRSALVVLEPEDIVRPYMKWAVKNSDWDKYKEAIKLAEGNYYLNAAPQVSLVFWTKDPAAFRDLMYTGAKSIAVHIGVAYACTLLVVCYVLAWTLIPARKSHQVLRQPEV